MKFLESSGYSFQGSITPDLMISKIWLALNLLALNKKFSTVYILGSWYGNMAYVLKKLNVPIDKTINVDINPAWLQFSKKLLGTENIEYMVKDANNLNYQQLDNNSIIINTSETDINGKNWWNNIPKGTLVAIQSRDNAENVRYKNIEELDTAYSMSKTLFLGTLNLIDPEIEYQRFMKIGLK